MFSTPALIHYLSAMLAVVLSGIGIGLGLSFAVDGMLEGLIRQGNADNPLTKTLMYGMFIIEGSFVISFIISISILFPAYSKLTLPIALGEFGMAMAVGLCTCFVGLASGFAVQGACRAVSRQPLFANKIQTMTIVMQTLIETPVFFSFVIALIIKTKLEPYMTITDGIKIMLAGCTTGMGSIGPSIGQLIFSNKSCFAPGMNKQSYLKIFAYSVLTEALIETPILFSFVVAIFIMFKKIIATWTIALATLSSVTFVISFGAMGTAIGIGMVGSKSAIEIAINPNNYPQILKTSLICQILIETANLFGFVTALTMLAKMTNI